MRTSTAFLCDDPASQFTARLVESDSGSAMLVVAGDVDLATQDRFARAVEEASAGASTVVVVDLSSVEFLSLSAVTVLARARAAAAAAGVVLELRCRPGVVARAVRLLDEPGPI